MNRLFDQNISYKVAKRLQDIFGGASHVSDLGLLNKSDVEIWDYARLNNNVVITFDYDFIDLSALRGYPPKIIWLRIGNATTEKIVSIFKTEELIIKNFLSDTESGFLEII